jgi:hypothetical protein
MNNALFEETTVLASFASRHDAEIAAARLESDGIESFIAADDVHPPLQMTGALAWL